MADDTLIEGHCERCLEDGDECDCLCETMEWCIENDCHCLLNDAVAKEDLDRIDTYLEMHSKVGGTLDDWNIYSSGVFLCGLEFMEITDTLRKNRINIEEAIEHFEKIRGYYNQWKDTFHWKCYLTFKKHRAEYVF